MSEKLSLWSQSQLDHLKSLQRPNVANYQSNAEAIQTLQTLQLQDVSIKSLANILNEYLAITCVPVQNHHTLAIYDYDEHIYMLNHTHFLRDCLVALIGESSIEMIESIKMTLLGMRSQLVKCIPLQNYQLVVNNGIYNALTGELNDFDPAFISLTKISTNYQSGFKNQSKLEESYQSFLNCFESKSHYEIMAFLKSLLFKSPKDSMYLLIGNIDNQLIVTNLLNQLFGSLNVAQLSFNDLMKYEYHMMLMNQKLVLSADNVSNPTLKDSLLLNLIARQPLNVRRQYAKSIYIPFEATIVECYSEMPIFAKSKALNQHIQTLKLSTHFPTLEITQEFLEYLLYKILNEKYYLYNSDFNTNDFLIEDEIDEFLMVCYRNGIFNSQFLPASHLYGAYFDYMIENGKQKLILSARGFSFKLQEKLIHYGYEFTTKSSRPGSIENYSVKNWSLFLNRYPHLIEVIDANKTTRLFEKTQKSQMSHSYESCTVFKYFQLEDDYKEFQLSQLKDVMQANEVLKVQRLEKEIKEKQLMLQKSKEKLSQQMNQSLDEVSEIEPIDEVNTEVEASQKKNDTVKRKSADQVSKINKEYFPDQILTSFQNLQKLIVSLEEYQVNINRCINLSKNDLNEIDEKLIMTDLDVIKNLNKEFERMSKH